MSDEPIPTSYYPEDGEQFYYVEFSRSGKPNEFTIFKRKFIHSKEEMERLEKECPADFHWLKMCNEVHPWNIFTSEFGPPGCMPDRKWVEWMVDALNEKVKNEETKRKRKEYYNSLPEDPNLSHSP